MKLLASAEKLQTIQALEENIQRVIAGKRPESLQKVVEKLGFWARIYWSQQRRSLNLFL